MLETLKVLSWPKLANVFEIGACEGEEVGKYAKVFPRADFWLFEPLPSNFEKLQATLSEHPKIKAKACQVALSDQVGNATFHVSSAAAVEADNPCAAARTGNKSSSLLAPRDKKPETLRWLDFPEAIEVRTETLDNFCEQNKISHIDFVHMDVQGAELKVLAGAKRMLPHIKAVWMEVAFEPTYEGQPLEPEATRWMAERGFRKIHQVSYGPEGDALYYNMRLPLAWPRFVALRMMQTIGLVRR